MANIDRLAYNRAGQLFTAANVAAKSVVAVSTTATGVILYNPVGSGKQLAIVDVGWAWTTVPAAVHNIGLAIMPPSPTTLSGLTAIGSGVLSGNGSGNRGASVAFAYDAATLPVAPVMQRISFSAAWASGAGVNSATLIDYVDGALMVQPGGALVFAVVTTTAIGLGSVSWIEV